MKLIYFRQTLTFTWPQCNLRHDCTVAREIRFVHAAAVCHSDVSEVPLIGEVAMSYSHSDSQDPPDRFGVDLEVFQTRIMRGILDEVIKLLGTRASFGSWGWENVYMY